MQRLFHILSISILVISLVLGVNVMVPEKHAQAMSGTGTPEDPYIITDIYELQAMQLDPEAYFELGNDIDASDAVDWNGGEGFAPIRGLPQGLL